MTEYYGLASALTRILEPRDHEVTKHATLTLDVEMPHWYQRRFTSISAKNRQ
jgi:hypothetical protein